VSGAATAQGVAPPAWGRTPRGWALNLDGSDAAQFTLPRLEIEQSPKGWLCRCRLRNGTSHDQLDDSGSIAVAQRTAAQLAQGRVDGVHAAVLAAILGA
jgi:hypothetical protein